MHDRFEQMWKERWDKRLTAADNLVSEHFSDVASKEESNRLKAQLAVALAIEDALDSIACSILHNAA